MVPPSFQLPVGVVLLAIGLAACFAGYRIFRIILTVYGVVLGGLLASALVPPDNTTYLMIALLVGGVLGGAAMWVGYFVGVGLVGAGLGAIVASSLWAHFRGEPSTAVIIVGAAVGAALAVSWQRYVLIVGTAFIGAQTAVAGTAALVNGGATPAAAGTSGAAPAWVPRLEFPQVSTDWTFIAWVALGVVGTIVQLRSGGKGGARRRP